MRKRPIDDSGNVKAFAGVAGKGAFLCGFAALAAAVFLAALFCGGNGGRDAWAAVTLPQNVIPTTKRGLPPEDNWKLTARKANVLFVLDVGSPMTFTATGTMPEWGVNVTTQAQAGQMLKQATYGHGGLDVEGTTSNSFPRTRYGREGLELVDEANNMTPGNTALSNHLNNYYSPDSENPYKLVFKNTKSGWWKNGPGNEQFTKADLVPNDSRMYKMKLVMWRVLSDVVLLENLRVGMATTFQELNGPSTGYGADFYKADPYGVWSSIPNFPYGTGPSWATNLADAFGNGQGYKDSASAYWGLDREYYDRSHSDRLWKLLNRAYLRLPIDDYSQGHIDKFRLWLDGQENITVTVNDSSKPYYFTNPELYGDGKTYLSTAIYPGHPHLSRATLISTTDTASPTGAQGVVFSHRSAATIASIYSGSSYGKALANFNAGAALGNYFKAGSGEALGTLLDFFSPPVSGIGDVTQDAQNVRMAPASSFPIRDQCEKNWVVIFTAGDDSGDDSAGYTSAEAVKKLYEFTRDNDVTKLSVAGTDSTNNTFEGVRLDDGVRTLVVGFVDPESTAANVVALRDKLNAMAVAGDPGNEKAKAYFANDTEGLINALRAVLARINSDIQPAPGPMTESPAMGDEEGGDEDENYNLFDASYRVVLYDQWMGSFARNEVKKIGDQLETEEVWELDTDLMSSNARDSRKIYYWR
ncbi:MAG: hypothetical protein LBF92_04710, partial [Synergistaceae bacterium]|nr:hypothetical protein [Synergistaceae bacterium]